jgi:DNA-binding transcriptional ArsR family regulator
MGWYPDLDVVVMEAVDDVFCVGDAYRRGDFAAWLEEGMAPVGLRVQTASPAPSREVDVWIVAPGNGEGCALVVRGEDGEAMTPDEFRCAPARNDTRARVLLAILEYIDAHGDPPAIGEIARAVGVSRSTVRYHYRVMAAGGLFAESWRSLGWPTAAGRRIAARVRAGEWAIEGE